ncbi:MAG TPA: multiheme c-type cytochrome [Terracidiphilus sp.]|nr:multiheme c-type cytochrome [Terracidiphilus sp.]HEV2473948.1 multiheme c-type cytochrome [Chthonomonadales bacterium]
MKQSDKALRRGRELVFALACTTLAPVLASQRASTPAGVEPAPPPASAYTGDKACAECHQKESEFYEATRHARDSAEATPGNVAGNFTPGHNILHTANTNLIVKMIHRPDGYFEEAENLANPDAHLTERIDIVIGSGRHGQTYLFWSGDDLFQMPSSWWTWNREWVVSPGLPPGQIHFDREVVPRCLECHGSYFAWENPPANHYDRPSLVLGIGCERCHGPGAEHVARERSAHPPALGSSEEAIVNPARLSRNRQMGLCSLCHAGAVAPLRPPLTFIAGDRIEDFIATKQATQDTHVDVHGHQVLALEASKCFKSSKMTCSTCHDVHRTQEHADSFAPRCLGCHKVQACGDYRRLGAKIRGQCIECHMPLQDSAVITSHEGSQALHALLRAHRIAVYPEATAAVERKLAGK